MENKKAVNCSLLQLTTNADNVQNYPARTRTHIENPCNDNGLCDFENSGGTKCVTLSDNGTLSPVDRQDLQMIISLWPELSPETKADIMELVNSERLTGGYHPSETT